MRLEREHRCSVCFPNLRFLGGSASTNTTSWSSDAIIAPVIRTWLFPKHFQVHCLIWPSCRPAGCSCIHWFSHLTFIVCQLHPARLQVLKIDAYFINEQTEVWRVVRWFVPNSMASGAVLGQDQRAFRPLHSPSCTLSPPHFSPSCLCSSDTETPGWHRCH